MAVKYKILKKRKMDMASIGFLSADKKRWLPNIGNAYKKHGLFSESEAIGITKQAEIDNPDYYYFRTVA